MKSAQKKKYSNAISTILFLIIVILLAKFSLDRIRTGTQNNIRESLQTVLQTTHEALYIWISQRKSSLKAIAESDELQQHTKQLINYNTTTKNKLYENLLKDTRKFLHPHLQQNHDDGFFIISPQMINIAASGDADLNTQSQINVQRPGFIEKVFRGETVFVPTMLVSKNLSHQPAAFIITPIFDKKMHIIAALAFQINPSAHFTRIAQLGRIGDSGETYAFDQHGLIITESRFDHQLRKIGLVKPGEKAMLSVRIADPGSSLLTEEAAAIPVDKRRLTHMAATAVTGKAGVNVDGYRDYRGVLVMGAWLWNNDFKFGLATEIDHREAMQLYNQTRLIIITLLITTILLSLFVYFILLKNRKVIEQQLEKKVIERTIQLENARNELELKNSQLQVLATTDALTNLANRRSFDKHIAEEWKRCSRDKIPLSILMIDVDYFKAYNDYYGHQQGDECLQHIAQILQSADIASRPGDLLARYGGEEFTVVLNNTTQQNAVAIAEKIRQLVQHNAIPHASTLLNNIDIVTLSIGVSTEVDYQGATLQELIEQADQALYLAKQSGRNCVKSG